MLTVPAVLAFPAAVEKTNSHVVKSKMEESGISLTSKIGKHILTCTLLVYYRTCRVLEQRDWLMLLLLPT